MGTVSSINLGKAEIRGKRELGQERDRRGAGSQGERTRERKKLE